MMDKVDDAWSVNFMMYDGWSLWWMMDEVYDERRLKIGLMMDKVYDEWWIKLMTDDGKFYDLSCINIMMDVWSTSWWMMDEIHDG